MDGDWQVGKMSGGGVEIAEDNNWKDFMGNVPAAEVRELLIKIGTGQLTPKLKNPDVTWNEVYAGNVFFTVDGWEVVIFNDCNSWDYVDSVVAPDGRRGEFDDWCGDGEIWDQPEYGLDDEVYRAMELAFVNAT